MGATIYIDTIRMGWSINYFKGLQVRIFKSIPVDFFILANSKDPDEMPHLVAFHLGLYCFPNYALIGF